MIRRGSPLVWALLLAGPALVLAFLGYRSVEQEDRLRRREALDAAVAAADAAMNAAVQRLDSIRTREEARPYYEYQARFMPADVTGVGPAFVQNNLGDLRGDPAGPTFWFRYVLAQGRIAGPEIFPEKGVKDQVTAFRNTYDRPLRDALGGSTPSFQAALATSTPIPLEVVAANEEVGQLLEEVEVSQKEGKQTAYLDGFSNRTQSRGRRAPSDATIHVHSMPLRYLSLPGGGPPLVAYRIVWIPGDEAKELRDAPVDRWVLVGHVYQHPLGVVSPEEPGKSAGPRLSMYGIPMGPGWAARRNLSDRMHIDGSPEMLTIVATVDKASLDAESLVDRRRYLWTAAGLLSVVAIGLFVLFRSVGREVDAARRKQDFVAAVTHELKTPLAGIRMYADMLKEGWVPDGETTGTYADRIVGETKRLSSLVDQVLDFSSFERGVASFQPVLGDLGVAVREAVELSTPAAREAGVAIRVDVEAGLAPVSFDGTLVRPLVVNLVDNAIKYSAHADAKDVVVSVRRDGTHVAVSVADKGVGIAAADRARVFEPFFRSGDEMTRTARGVGIGLALVVRYAKAHDAPIQLESEVGRGTTVTVRFKAAPAN